MTPRERAPGLRPSWLTRLSWGQAADLSVSQAVEDEGEEFAGGGDPPDVRCCAVRDPVILVWRNVPPRCG